MRVRQAFFQSMMGLLLLSLVSILSSQAGKITQTQEVIAKTSKAVVVLDAGQGNGEVRNNI